MAATDTDGFFKSDSVIDQTDNALGDTTSIDHVFLTFGNGSVMQSVTLGPILLQLAKIGSKISLMAISAF